MIYDEHGNVLGRTLAEAAQALGRPRSTVRMYARWQGDRRVLAVGDIPAVRGGHLPAQPVYDTDGRQVAPSIAQAARAMGVSYATLKMRLRTVRGRLVLQPRVRWRGQRVTNEDRAALLRMREAGLSRRGARQALGISTTTLEREWRAAQVDHDRHPARTVARWLGIDEMQVAVLIERGLLAANRSRPEGRGVWRIARRDVLAMLCAERVAWVAVPLAGIADAELRAAATRAQELAGGRWWSMPEVGLEVGLSPSGVYERLIRGWFDGWETARWGKGKGGGALYIWRPTGAPWPVYQVDQTRAAALRRAAREANARAALPPQPPRAGPGRWASVAELGSEVYHREYRTPTMPRCRRGGKWWFWVEEGEGHGQLGDG